MLVLLLEGALLAQASTVPVPVKHQVGGFMLLTNGAYMGQNLTPRTAPVLTDAQGHTGH